MKLAVYCQACPVLSVVAFRISTGTLAWRRQLWIFGSKLAVGVLGVNPQILKKQWTVRPPPPSPRSPTLSRRGRLSMSSPQPDCSRIGAADDGGAEGEKELANVPHPLCSSVRRQGNPQLRAAPGGCRRCIARARLSFLEFCCLQCLAKLQIIVGTDN